MVKPLPSNAGGAGSIPGQGAKIPYVSRPKKTKTKTKQTKKESSCQCRGHGFEPWSGKIPHAMKQLSPCITTTEPAP